MVWPATSIPGAIVLDLVLMLTGNMLMTAIFGGMALGLMVLSGQLADALRLYAARRRARRSDERRRSDRLHLYPYFDAGISADHKPRDIANIRRLGRA